MGLERSIKIFHNGRIYTKFKPLKIEESLVTKGDRIEYCGTSEDAMKHYGKRADSIIDLKGKSVIPGFVDSHMHLDDLGGSLNFLNLRGIGSIEEMRRKVLDYRSKNPGALVILGTGWDQESFSERRWPNRWDIDDIVGDIPVYLERFCEHSAVVNSKMLELLPLNKFQESIVPCSAGGKLTGIVKEEASWYLKDKALALSKSLERNLIAAARYMLSLGVTKVGFVSCGCDSIDFLSKEAQELGLRVNAYLKAECGDRLGELRRAVGNNAYLQINGIKLFADGALGAGTAALVDPYSDDSRNRGILYLDSGKLVDLFRKFNKRKVQFAIHAIGDRGIDAVIDAISDSHPSELTEPRIEHCTVLRKEHIARLREMGIGVTVQPAFVIDDWWAVRRLGIERSRMSYPLASLYNGGVKLGISTDSPVEPPDPWLTVDAAVNRGEEERREILKYSAEEKLDLASVLHLYTAGSAALLMDHEGGTLEPGELADFVILNKDPFKTKDLKSIRSVETIVGGVSRFRVDQLS